MKFPSTIIGAALLATSIVASPLTSRRQASSAIQRSARAMRRTSPPYTLGTSEELYLNQTIQETYSSNWAGAVLIGTGYTSVSGEITVPFPQLPRGANSYTNYCASAWVGIDGDTCNTAILQTGIDFCIQGETTSYSAWYEWYPDYAHDFSNIQISAGDVIKSTVDATSRSSGSVTLENLSTGVSATHIFPHGIGGNLCEFNAEWIVEDFSVNNAMAPFANFGTVVFSNAVASRGRTTYGPSNATIMDIYQDRILTSSSVTGNTVTVSYI
ncbi:Concanavalin A-like lectin/glucanases superfamily [Penicillium coprophilum]|uniref:Concanavalin A-like lectin/glucanases superfamily n=1 Tax=Penicillium coprophilum TaxID=36646 RepID=UPI00238E9CE7|nr:Concanavalin A-like lectin/glucanases superfamily [Penicillium coprophilum]KAJ5178671.1 Concanavalin A-like lectin/glucanases superfamily [Penicillium coprophilum]